MTKIEAIVRKGRLEGIKEALEKCGVQEITFNDVLGRGKQKGNTRLVEDKELLINFTPKVKIEIVTGGNNVDQIVSVFTEEARTGRIGDGKIFIYPC